MRLTIKIWANSESKVSVCTTPDWHIPGIAMGEGALHELAGHECGLGRIRDLLNINYSIQKELLCEAGSSERAFHSKAPRTYLVSYVLV